MAGYPEVSRKRHDVYEIKLPWWVVRKNRLTAGEDKEMGWKLVHRPEGWIAYILGTLCISDVRRSPEYGVRFAVSCPICFINQESS